MGRKGVSKRKPKKSNTGSSDNSHHGSSNVRASQSPSSVQSLVNAGNAHLNRGDAESSNGSNKKTRKGR
jgi:hypothetical protein